MGAVYLSLRVPINRDEAISWRGMGLPRFAGNAKVLLDKSGDYKVRRIVGIG
jgi:hypothetical protein